MSQMRMFADAPITVPDLGLRPYQREALAAIHAAHEQYRGCLVVMFTGAGKTRLVGAACWDHRLRGNKCLVLCPTIELCLQMARNLLALGLHVGVEQADKRADRPLPDVVVASIATMRGKRLESFARDDFGLVVFDEAHKAVSSGPLSIFAHFENALRLGVTATPDRADRKSLASLFDVCAYEMHIMDGIEQGWLVPLRFRTVETDWDPARLREIAGDVDAESVVEELTRSGCMSSAVHALSELAGQDRAISFLPTVASSMAFRDAMNSRHPRSPYVAQWCAHIDGTTPQKIRDEVFAAFKIGTTRVITNVGILVEGFDAPHATVCAILSPTKSRAKLAQMIGRVTRTSPGKTHATILDFCPGRLAKGRLAAPADVLAGEVVSDDVLRQLAVKPVFDVADFALAVQEDEAKKRREQEAKAEALARKQAAKAARMARRIQVASSLYGIKDHDAYEILMGKGDIDKRMAARGLRRVDVDAERKELGLCSVKQAAFLAKKGLNPDMSARQAGLAMARISENNWQVPEWMYQSKDFALVTRKTVGANR